MKLTIVAGARPNFVKIAPLIHAIHRANIENANFDYRLVHTGQHYDDKMSGSFFRELEIPIPHINLNVGSGSQSEITANIMVAFEIELHNHLPDLVVVVGDVTSTLACTITAKKLNIKVAHIEAGIRSFDMSMPEEINRIVTDSIADYFFTTTPEASKYLKSIGKDEKNIFFVGNIMIDTLLNSINKLKQPEFYKLLNLLPQQYFVLTAHRPSNVDETDKLMELIMAIANSAFPYPVIFPIHPRTKKQFLLEKIPVNLKLTEPLGYLEFQYLIKDSICILTDSGGITEEATVMNIPCITLRNSTERPETVTIGSNVIAGTDSKLIDTYIQMAKKGQWKQSSIPKYWDGKTATRIIKVLYTLA